MKLAPKLTAGFLSAALLPMLFLGFMATANVQRVLIGKTLSEMNIIADTLAARVATFAARNGKESDIPTLVRDRAAFGDTGEVLVIKREGDNVYLIARSGKTEEVQGLTLPLAEAGELFTTALAKDRAVVTSVFDERRVPVIAVTRFLPDAGWAIVVRISEAEVTTPIRSFRIALIVTGFIVLVFSALTGGLTAWSVARPVQRLTGATRRFGEQSLEMTRLEPVGVDEIDELSDAFTSMTERIRSFTLELEGKVRERTGQLEEALKDVQKFQLAVASSADAVMITDATGKIIYLNPAWTKLFGYTLRDIRDRTYTVIENDITDPSLYNEMHQALSVGREFKSDALIGRSRSGRQFNLEATFYPVRHGLTLQFYVGLLQDVTVRKQEERAKNEFVSLAAHQLRTPLTAIRWGLSRLRHSLGDAAMPVEAGQLLETLQRSAKNMAETIGTMLTISRIAAGKIKLEPEPVDVRQMFTDIQNDFVAQCEKENKQVVLDVDQDTALTTDRKLLREVVMNLTSNALKYSPEGSKVMVRAKRGDGKIRLDIQDFGYGIPVAQQSKVFTIFFRGDNVIRRQVDGTGLGLYLVYSLVTFLGGDISFVSVEDQGTTFTMLLPLTPPTHDGK